MMSRDPYPETQRAPYALPEGVPALQDDPVVTRRRVLLVVMGSATLGATLGFGLALASLGKPAPTPAQRDPQRDAALRWVNDLVAGPVSRLVENGLGFLLWFELYGDDPGFWRGVELLVQEVERNPALEVQGFVLAERLGRAVNSRRSETPVALLVRVDNLVARIKTPQLPR